MIFTELLNYFLILIFVNFLRAELSIKDVTTDEFQLDCLLIHNKIREKHCSQKVRFSNKLKTLATRRATVLAQNNGQHYTRIPDSTFGENVFRHKFSLNSTKIKCEAIVLRWYRERLRFNWNLTNSVNSHTRRFAQILWNSTQRIGCAAVASVVGMSGHVYIVCNYFNSVKFPDNSWQNIFSVERCDQILSKRRFKYKALTTGEWLQQCINEHNRIRKLHSVDTLTINTEMFQFSQKRAKEMAEKGFRFFRHKNSEFGENILWTESNEINGSLNCNDSISKWYRELERYDWEGRVHHNGTVRHFVQIVWRSTKFIGCSVVQNIEEEKGGFYTVCIYEPKAYFNNPDLEWDNVFPSGQMIEGIEPPIESTTNETQPHDYEHFDDLDDETELEKEFKDMDDVIDVRKFFEKQTPAPSLEDMYIKTTTEYNGFDRSKYIPKSKGIRRKI